MSDSTSPAVEPPPVDGLIRLIYIVDLQASEDWRRLDAVLEGGATALWLRAPGATGQALYRATKGLVQRAHGADAAVIVGDRADVALAAGADAVQLGFRSPPAHRIRPWFGGRIGVSCHTAGELQRAEKAGADYAILSPVFGVPDKGAPLGPALFQKLAEGVGIPVVALGGIEPTTQAELDGRGAAGFAVIRALRDVDDPGAAARQLRDREMTPR